MCFIDIECPDLLLSLLAHSMVRIEQISPDSKVLFARYTCELGYESNGLNLLRFCNPMEECGLVNLLLVQVIKFVSVQKLALR